MARHYHKAGLLAINEGRILLCRKSRDTSLLILPGGRIEASETPEQCLRRELQEELGPVEVRNLQFLGRYLDVAADHPANTVDIELYAGQLEGEPKASAEIRELVWFGLTDDRSQLAPSIRKKILPDLIRRGILPWPE